MIVLIDLGVSNTESVVQGFRRVGAPVSVVSSARDLETAGAVVLPGVGSFRQGMESLCSRGLAEPLRQFAASGRPVLGICLGMQLLAEEGEEHGPTAGLRLIKGRVTRLTPKGSDFRVPNIGWCDVLPVRGKGLFRGIEANTPFYFVHSYGLVATDPYDVAAIIDSSGESIAIAIERGNLFGVQFHPEKSQDAGLDILKNFVELVQAGPAAIRAA